MTTIKLIRELEQIDLLLMEASDSLDGIKATFGDETSVLLQKEKVDAGQERLKTAKQDNQSLEHEAESIRTKLEEVESKLYGGSVTSPRELEDLAKEIENLSDMIPYSIIADLSSQKEIKRAADEFKSLNIPLHILLNNAGLINMERKETVDGFEEVFALNHLAYYSLTQLLLDNIKNGSPSRIVNVSSGAHAFVKGFNFDDVQSLSSYKPFQVYGYSKLANILFTKKLASLLKDENVSVNCLHPGVVGTAFGQNNGSL